MTTRKNVHPARANGSQIISSFRFAPGVTTVAGMAEASGVSSITRNGAGDYTIVLTDRPKGFVVALSLQSADTTLFHQLREISHTDSTTTVRIVHRSVAFASVASGDALSDSFDFISAIVTKRGE